jgi:Putative sensor
MIMLLVGVPVLIATLWVCRGLAEIERARLTTVLRVPRRGWRYKTVEPEASPLRRFLLPFVDPQYWLDALHAVLIFAIATATFSILLTWWTTAIAGLLYPVYGWLVPQTDAWHAGDLASLLGMDGVTGRIAFYTAVGVFFAGTLPLVARTTAVVQASVSRALLDGPASLRGQTYRPEPPQQTTAAVPVPEPIPAVLADHGLTAALTSLAGHSRVPVDLRSVDVGRLHPAVEGTAYFVVAEALANVAKHSGASQCRVSLELLGDRLLLTVADDGVGGAYFAYGHGLAWLADRTRATGGTLLVDSPAGGPTTITTELPWRWVSEPAVEAPSR